VDDNYLEEGRPSVSIKVPVELTEIAAIIWLYAIT
jgi:hypothetical protein